jgi:hypothetical protein
MKAKIRRRKCLHCKNWFLPKQQKFQRFCLQPECQKASKIASQKKWLAKLENKNIWQGPSEVLRVKIWRQRHPFYWKLAKPDGNTNFLDATQGV